MTFPKRDRIRPAGSNPGGILVDPRQRATNTSSPFECTATQHSCDTVVIL